MKSVLMSIKPEYCELIANGKKTIEVRKTKPKLETPFKCYIYCTKPKPLLALYNKELFSAFEEDFDYYNKNTVFKVNGKVIGEFVCDDLFTIGANAYGHEYIERVSCLSHKELENYQGEKTYIWGWHISDLKIYDEPKELSKFIKCTYPFDCCACDFWDSTYLVCAKPIRPPQSWCYVEELEG